MLRAQMPVQACRRCCERPWISVTSPLRVTCRAISGCWQTSWRISSRVVVFVVVLGGGHETAYGHFLGYVGAGSDVRILNWDAHPDVREPSWRESADAAERRDGHSGSPFRQAIVHSSGRCRHYRVAGLAPWSSAADHIKWIREAGGRVDFLSVELERQLLEDATGLYAETSPEMVSFDLDAVEAGAAPGVSAPAALGMKPGSWLAAAREAGRHPTVRSVDVVELCPDHDVEQRTARLAASTVWQVLAGYSAR